MPLLLCTTALRAQWGRDLEPGRGEQLLRLVEQDLAAALKAHDFTRMIQKHADARIEAIKRFRNPELRPLFLELLDHDRWPVQHRAILALELIGDGSDLPRIWKLLTHPHRRIREKAAIACILLWREGAPQPGDLDSILTRERDFYVRSCLRALQQRILGKLSVKILATEKRERHPDGLEMAPFTRAPKGRTHPILAQEAKPSALYLPPAPRWSYPLLAWGEEEVENAPLQPYSLHPGGNLSPHRGQDMGAGLDGAGYYAAAQGVVRSIETGAGTTIVIEHELGSGERVNTVYRHAGATVFVKPGEQVEGGQLIATMGMGFSRENGGRFAHLEFGLYAGRFRSGNARRGWRNPVPFLRSWIERTKPLLQDLPRMGPKLAPIVALLRRGEWGRAHSAAERLQDKEEPGTEAYVDANLVVHKLRAVPQAALIRAKRLMQGGYPGRAARQLKELAARCKGIPQIQLLRDQLSTWDSNALIRKALRGQTRIAVAQERAAKTSDSKQIEALWRALLKEYGDTCLAPRIRAYLPQQGG